jgi:uncharacterized protein YyaL (SSP411 family)
MLFRLYHHWRNGATEELREASNNSLEMALHTLERIAYGGIHDHLDGGFHQYSTTPDWHIPHYGKL